MTIKIKQKFKRIITHSGRFHADEVFAIAFLLFHNLVETDYEIVRLNNYDNFNKKNTDIVIDIGGKLDSKNNNVTTQRKFEKNHYYKVSQSF